MGKLVWIPGLKRCGFLYRNDEEQGGLLVHIDHRTDRTDESGRICQSSQNQFSGIDCASYCLSLR
jgi:hypothetical protein